MPGIYWPKNRVFPKFSKPNALDVIDLRSMNFYDNFKYLPLITLQGIVNRERPQIYVMLTDLDEKFIKLIQKENIQINKISLEDVMSKYSRYCNGYITYDPEVPDTLNLANTMSGIYNSIVIHPKDIEWIESLGFREFEDLRGKFKDKVSVYEWAYEELWPKCNHRLLVPMRPYHEVNLSRPMQIAVRDYVAALKLFAHYLNPCNYKELDLFKKILKEMPDNSAILGWYEGSEHVTVRLASEYNKFVVVITGNPYLVANLTVWSGINVEVKFKLPSIDFNKLGEDKVYVTFYMNDGDNVQWDIEMRKFWDDPFRGKIPIAWTISPFLIDLAPLVMKYYVESMSENDTFVSGPSGAGYWYPNVNPSYIKKFLELTNEYFKRTGLRITEILGEFLDGESLIHYSKELNLLAIKIGYRGMDIFPYYLDEVPTPIIPGTVEFREGKEKSAFNWLKAIALVYKKRPLHVLVICVPWFFKSLRPLKILVEKISKDENFVLVNFHEFIIMLNPKYGIEICEHILREIKGKTIENNVIIKIEDVLKRAKKYYRERKWALSSLEINRIFKILKLYGLLNLINYST